jgi:hypothetical protein
VLSLEQSDDNTVLAAELQGVVEQRFDAEVRRDLASGTQVRSSQHPKLKRPLHWLVDTNASLLHPAYI